ncbi:MAG: 50S ribosomal protein L18 [Gammaproteobacteria bacterium]
MSKVCKTPLQRREKRARKARGKQRFQLQVPVLSVHKSCNHIYVQFLRPDRAAVLASASSLDKKIRGQKTEMKPKEVAHLVGKMIGEKVIALGYKKIGFDRSGFLYHGRVKAVADGAREAGLEF